MYISMHFVLIIWSSKLLSASIIPEYYRYGNLSAQNYSSNHEPKSVVPKENCTLKNCLQKCCESGQIYSIAKGQCDSPSEEQLAILNTTWNKHFPRFNIIIDNPSCPGQPFIVRKFRGHEYQLDENGILHVPRIKKHKLSTFCFEYISEDDALMPIVCLNDNLNEGEESERQFMYYAYGMTLSNVFLLITLGLYISTPALHRSVQDKSFSCYVISLIFGFSFLIAAQNTRKDDSFCIVIAYMTQFWQLARFFWLNAMCIDIQYAVNTSELLIQSSKRKFSSYCWYAWGCPILISLITALNERLLTNDWKPGLGVDDCWFRKYNGHFLSDPKFLYFNSVISITLIINICIFSDTVFMIQSRNQKWEQNHPDSRRHKQQQKRFLFHLKLFLVMGLNWILEMASYYFEPVDMADLWFVVDMVNCLQGVFIFSIFVCNKKVIRLLERRFFPRRTFSKEYARLLSNRNSSRSSQLSQISSTTYRLSLPQKDIKTCEGKI